MIPRRKRPVLRGSDSDLHWEAWLERYAERRRRRETSLLAGLLMIILALLVLGTLLVCERACADGPADVPFSWVGTRADHETRIDLFLTDYFSKCSPRKLARAREVVPVLLDVCEAAQVNPALVAAIVTHESTWDASAVGGLGERGLMQVAPNAHRGEVPADAEGQLRLGVRILTEAYARCGTTIGAVSWYGTGSTCKPYRGAERRLRMAAKIQGATDGRD